MSELTIPKVEVLTELAACQIGKGIPIPKGSPKRRVAGSLIRQGYAMWMGVGDFRVYIITDEGRAALAEHKENL